MRFHHHYHGAGPPMHEGAPGERPGSGRTVPEPAYEFLDPERLRLWRSEGGRVRLTIDGDRSYLDVKVVRTFPRSEPERYLGLLSRIAGDRVIGIVVDPGGMDPESQRTAMEALQGQYFLPTILRITRLKEEFGAVYIDAETDRGARHFVARGIRDAVEQHGEGELILPDVDGNRYRIADWRRLDSRSRRLLERVV